MTDERGFDETLELLPPPPGMTTNGAFRMRREPCHRKPSTCASTSASSSTSSEIRAKPVNTVAPISSTVAPLRSDEVIATHSRYENRRENLTVIPGTQIVSDDDSNDISSTASRISDLAANELIESATVVPETPPSQSTVERDPIDDFLQVISMIRGDVKWLLIRVHS
jgi:hypothetical protein